MPPVPASWHFALARALVRGGKLDEATRAFQAGLAVDPEDKAGWLGFARVLHAIGDLRGAIEAWEKVSSLDPGAWEPFNDIGSAWMEMR